jgi:hypothetical protein
MTSAILRSPFVSKFASCYTEFNEYVLARSA